MLPAALQAQVEAALSAGWREDVELRAVQATGGGCISNASRLTTSSGKAAFLKWSRRGELPRGLFDAEARGLRALAATGSVRVPQIIAQNTTPEFEWLLLEWLEPVPMTGALWQKFGRALAQLHRSTNAQFGFDHANYIGSLPQSNIWTADWPEFWRTQRLLPQLELATRRGALTAEQRRRFDPLLEALDEMIEAGNRDGSALLHGDFWSANVHGMAGDVALIDPAIYFGHREVDLAMAALFGGFSDGFFRTYDEAWPLQADAARRRHVYQLYYLLVHVNLFGGSYLASTLAAVRKLGF